MYSIVYLSAPSVEFSMKDIEGLISKSVRNNEKADVTGILLYKSGMFVQC